MEKGEKLSRYLWRGDVVGTNSGPIVACFDLVGDHVQARALFWDATFGPTLLEAHGPLEGSTLKLVMIRQGALRLQYSVLQLDFDTDFNECSGKWITAYMTGGAATLRRAALRNRLVRAAFELVVGPFVLGRWVMVHIQTTYALALLSLALLDGTTKAYHLRYPALVVFVVIAAYLYQAVLLDVVRRFGIRRIGGVELQPSQSSPGASDQSLAAALAGMPDALLLLALDGYLVARTKALLAWIAQGQEDVTRGQLLQRALELGVTADNIGPTLEALLVTGCVVMPTGDSVKVTPRGTALVRQIARMAGGDWLPTAGS